MNVDFFRNDLSFVPFLHLISLISHPVSAHSCCETFSAHKAQSMNTLSCNKASIYNVCNYSDPLPVQSFTYIFYNYHHVDTFVLHYE